MSDISFKCRIHFYFDPEDPEYSKIQQEIDKLPAEQVQQLREFLEELKDEDSELSQDFKLVPNEVTEVTESELEGEQFLQG